MRKILYPGHCIIAAALAGSSLTAFAGPTGDTEKLRTEIQNLKAVQRQTQARLELLEANLNKLLSSRATTSPALPATEAIHTLPVNAGSYRDSRLSLSGDARVRAETNFIDGDSSRSRMVVRARVRGEYALADSVTLGSEVVTGDLDDPNTADVTLSNFNDDIALGLSQLYLRAKTGYGTLWAGKFANPFYHTDLVWDGDVNPQGIAASFDFQATEQMQTSLAALGMVIDEQSAGSDSTMLGVQWATRGKPAESWDWLVALGYYDYSLNSVNGADGGDFRSNRVDINGRYISDFDLLDLVARVNLQGFGEHWPVNLSLNVVENLGAVDTSGSGYLASLGLGRLANIGDTRFRLGLHRVNQDAVFAAFSHDNLTIATGYRALEWGLDYQLMESLQLNLNWYHYQALDSALSGNAGDTDAWLDRVRLNLSVSF